MAHTMASYFFLKRRPSAKGSATTYASKASIVPPPKKRKRAKSAEIENQRILHAKGYSKKGRKSKLQNRTMTKETLLMKYLNT